MGSTLRTKGMVGRWTEVRERITYSYNNLRHSTTAQTPTNLVFGRPIHKIINLERANELYYFSENEIEILHHGNEAEIKPLPILDEEADLPDIYRHILSLNEQNESNTNNLRPIARESIHRAAERIIRNVGWRYDRFYFEIGDRVMIRPSLDTNLSTRRRPLYEHLDTRVYIIVNIIRANKVKLISKDDTNNMIEEIATSVLRKI